MDVVAMARRKQPRGPDSRAIDMRFYDFAVLRNLVMFICLRLLGARSFRRATILHITTILAQCQVTEKKARE